MISERIDVTTDGQANRAVERFMRRVDKCTEDLLQALAEDIQLHTIEAYSEQAADGNTHYSVTISSEDANSRSVTASGSDVMFLEFGAGYGVDVGHEWAEQVGDVEIGSWSKAHNGQFIKDGYWRHGGKRYTGIQATRGLLNAFDEASELVEEMADEVFQ